MKTETNKKEHKLQLQESTRLPGPTHKLTNRHYVYQSAQKSQNCTLPAEIFLVACYATLHPALSVGPSVRPSVRPSVTLYFFVL